MATMVVMAAKFAGKCRRCGRPILPGTQMDWTREGGALHLTPEECEAAPAVLELRGPQPERQEDRARAEHLLLSHTWKVATSARYAKLPHAYTLRRTWANDSDFIWVVEHIRRVGYQEQFIGRIWIYFDVGVYQHWDCGGPVSGVGLINRAVRRPASARSKVVSGS